MSSLKYKLKIRVGNFAINTSAQICKMKDNSFLGKLIFAVYQKMLHIANMSVYPVVSADKYQVITGNVEETIIETNRMGVSGNIIMAGSNEETVLKTSPLPDLKLYKYNKVCITGDSDVVVDKERGYVISDAAFNLQDNEVVIDGLMYRSLNNVCLLRDNLHRPMSHFYAGIMISGKFCQNYYHLMYENLIRLIYLDRVNIPKDVPLIVDRKSMTIPSCKSIFDTLTKGTNRQWIEIDTDKMYSFEEFYCFSRINVLPSHSANPHKSLCRLYSSESLLYMRSKLIPYQSGKIYPKRFVISRAGTKVRHYNEQEIFQSLKKYGFECVAPEKLCFNEQMSLFSGAEYIISGSGAALTNLLFITKKCTVICFGRSSYDEISDVPIFNTIANINGARFYFFPRKSRVTDNVHVDYEIDCRILEKFISELINNNNEKNLSFHN